jgi:hypothetical protein
MVMLAVLFLSFGAEAKLRLFSKGEKKMILSNPCVMSYTDDVGKITRVIRSNPIIIILE